MEELIMMKNIYFLRRLGCHGESYVTWSNWSQWPTSLLMTFSFHSLHFVVFFIRNSMTILPQNLVVCAWFHDFLIQLACARIGSEEGKNYLSGMAAAANYAWVNRSSMTFLTRQVWCILMLHLWLRRKTSNLNSQPLPGSDRDSNTKHSGASRPHSYPLHNQSAEWFQDIGTYK